MTEPSDFDDKISVAEAAQITGLTPGAVKYNDRELQPVRVGRTRVRLYSRAHVLAWTEARRAAERARAERRAQALAEREAAKEARP